LRNFCQIIHPGAMGRIAKVNKFLGGWSAFSGPGIGQAHERALPIISPAQPAFNPLAQIMGMSIPGVVATTITSASTALRAASL